jgi:predicted hotdog family 3-hydroxylacyl-ACP dehydratase
MFSKKELCDLIPHSDFMCLIDSVESWDDKKIIVFSNTHQDKKNPMRNHNILSTTALIEYGAQAMAIHGALLQTDKMEKGYLAALRNIYLQLEDISQIKDKLCIQAEQQLKSEGNMIYQFSITANQRLLASGRATVVAIK